MSSSPSELKWNAIQNGKVLKFNLSIANLRLVFIVNVSLCQKKLHNFCL